MEALQACPTFYVHVGFAYLGLVVGGLVGIGIGYTLAHVVRVEVTFKAKAKD